MFKVGDKVRIIDDFGNPRTLNKIGIVVKVHDNNHGFNVEFDEEIFGWGDKDRSWFFLNKHLRYAVDLSILGELGD